jgi:Tfp pilus assembly protein PilO
MKEKIVSNLHWIIIFYALFDCFELYEQKEVALESSAVSIPVIEAKIIKAERKIKQIESFKKNLSKSKERVKEVVKQIEKVQKQLPSDVNDTVVQSIIGDIANKLKIKEPSPVPEKETNNGFYFAKDYRLTAYGTFIQFLIFFENLNQTERILNVKSLNISFDKDKTKGRFPIVSLSAIIESFRYNQNYKEKSGVEEIENKFK